MALLGGALLRSSDAAPRSNRSNVKPRPQSIIRPIIKPIRRAAFTPITFSNSELWKPIARLDDPQGAPGFHGTAIMHDGYLVIPTSGLWNGKSYFEGGFSFYDISNPRRPILVKRLTHPLQRESHSIGSHYANGKKYVATLAANGILIWDWTNFKSPILLKNLVLPGITPSDYEAGAWWLHWQAPYLYVGGSSNGLYIVDATNPANPVLRKKIDNAALGTNFRCGTVCAVGNLLTILHNSGEGFATFDISNPLNPVLLFKDGSQLRQYSGLVNGNRQFIATGRSIDGSLRSRPGLGVFDLTDPARPARGANLEIGTDGGYLTTQDGFVHLGSSNGYYKITTRDNLFLVDGSSSAATMDLRDTDFISVIGNFTVVSDDDGDGSVLVPHQTAPDWLPPQVTMIVPASGATNQSTLSRVGVTFSDRIDARSLNPSTFAVRAVSGPNAGIIVPGFYSEQTGVVNFGPAAPLATGTTYEVTIAGIKDYAGNALATPFRSRFSTSGQPPAPTTGSIENTPNPGAVGETIQLRAAGFTIPNGQFAWDFGDGSAQDFSQSTLTSHSYTRAGHFTIILSVRDASGQITRVNATQTIIHPRQSTLASGAATIAYEAGRNRVFVVNSDANTVAALDATSGAKLWETGSGRNPRTLAIRANGEVWVANQDDATVAILDGEDGSLRARLNLPRASRPFGIAFDAASTFAFVTLEATGKLARIDAATRKPAGQIDVGPKPRGLAISGDGKIFVARFISPDGQGEVRQVNAGSFSVARTIGLAIDAGPDTESSGRGLPNYLGQLAISPDGRRLWVPSKKDNIGRGLMRDGQRLNFESTVRTIVSQINVAGGEDLAARRDINNGDMANAVAFTPQGDYAFIALQGSNRVAIHDALNNAPIGAIENVGSSPQGMAVSADGTRLFVQNFLSRDVAIYDVSSVGKSNQFPLIARTRTASIEALAPQVLLGKKIFYNANDPHMSQDSYISCASCHLEGDSDGRVWDFSQRGEGARNTITLQGRGGTGHGPQHWTGNFDETQDFENDIRNEFGGRGFLSDAAFHLGTRANPLGDRKAGLSPDLDALSAFVGSLSQVHESPFKNECGALSGEAAAGKVLFESAGVGCATCHVGPNFTDSAPGKLHDVGTISGASGKRIGSTLSGFDTPSLLSVWESAPYLHDGSAATIRDVLTTKNRGDKHGKTSQLSSTQIAQIEAYILQIDGRPTISIPPATVTTTADLVADDCEVSLREALLYANAHPNTTITFALPTDDTQFRDGIWTIKPASPLPPVTAAGTVLDGASQRTFAGDTNPAGPEVLLAGNTASGNAIQLQSARGVVKHLAIGNFSAGAGILVANTARDNRIENCFIGTDATATAPMPNRIGVQILGVRTVVGAAPSALDPQIGGNRIAFNRAEGVLIAGNATGNSVRGNSIVNNGTLGINLQNASEALNRPTPNDRGDADSGANAGQNFPLITGIAARDDRTIISGTLESTLNTAFVIDLHFNNRADASGYGEGETWAGSMRVTTGINGTAAWSIALTGSFIGETFSATATNLRTQDTGEFGPVKTISQDTPPTVAFSYPLHGATVSDVSGIRGLARDPIAGSGISLVVFYIRRQSDGLYWNSDTAWNFRPIGFSTQLQNGTPSSANWVRPIWLPGLNGVLPTGANLKPGAYTLQVAAYNGLGNIATAAITINVVAGGAAS